MYINSKDPWDWYVYQKTIQLDVRKYGIHGSCWHFFDVHPKKIPSVSLGCSFPSILGGFLNTSGLNNGLEIGGKSRNHWTIYWIIHILQVVRIVSDIFGANSGGAWAAGDPWPWKPLGSPNDLPHVWQLWPGGGPPRWKHPTTKESTTKMVGGNVCPAPGKWTAETPKRWWFGSCSNPPKKNAQSDKFIPFFRWHVFFF